MVAAGSISPEEAQEVLAALDPSPATSPSLGAAAAEQRAPASTADRQRTLAVSISDGGMHIGIHLPPGLTPDQQRFLVSRKAREYLEKEGIDLEEYLAMADQFPRGTPLLNIANGGQHIAISVA